MWDALDNLERFLHHPDPPPILIYVGLAHAQFETIHPVLDGNGRVGRLLITLLLCHHGVLHLPVLYLSAFLKRHRAEYYDRLTAIREAGDWEGWLGFFLRGVLETAEEAARTAREILDLRERHRLLIQQHQLERHGLRLLELLFRHPVVNVRFVEQALGVKFGTVSALLSRFAEIGIVTESTGGRRNRKFRYSPYLALFTEPPAAAPDPTDPRLT